MAISTSTSPIARPPPVTSGPSPTPATRSTRPPSTSRDGSPPTAALSTWRARAAASETSTSRTGRSDHADAKAHGGILPQVLDPLRLPSARDDVVAPLVLDKPDLDGPRQPGDSPLGDQVEKLLARAFALVGCHRAER